MTNTRFLGVLAALAMGLLIFAVALSGGSIKVDPQKTLQVPMAAFGALPIEWPGGLLAGDPRSLAIGGAIGWGARWVYSLPWAAIPRAIVAWILGWRSSVMMLGLALVCGAVLFFY